MVSGRLDGANVPARAWDALGVTTLRALNAPFLLESDSAVADVVTGDLAPELLAGLDGAGVTGLGLVAEGQRRLVFFGDAVVPTDAMAGRVIRAPRSGDARRSRCGQIPATTSASATLTGAQSASSTRTTFGSGWTRKLLAEQLLQQYTSRKGSRNSARPTL